MITFSKIGKKGNLGNQLFQIAATIGLATENNFEYGFLYWNNQKYFKNKLPVIPTIPTNTEVINENHFHHHSWNFTNKSGNYDLVGWLQTEKYFNIAKTKHYFEFEDQFKERIKAQYATTFLKKTILISIRRGDFVNHPHYLQLSIKYYLNALVRFFPDWQSRNIIVLSDDIAYCKFHFSFLENAFFGDHLNALEQLCLGSLCDDFIISNSTFSWWSAWLGEKEKSTIIRPHKNFEGNKSLESNDKDYYPERWISYNASSEKLPLKDMVFYLNFENNKEILRDYLSHYFDAEIQFNLTPATNFKNKYVFKNNYMLPPLLIYYSYLKKLEFPGRLVLNNILKIFKVSKPLNYEEFSSQQDFGLFSSIFNFKALPSRTNAATIYIDNNSISTDENQRTLFSDTVSIDCNVGQFSKTGFAFSFKRYLGKIKIMIKGKIKKILYANKK